MKKLFAGFVVLLIVACLGFIQIDRLNENDIAIDENNNGKEEMKINKLDEKKARELGLDYDYKNKSLDEIFADYIEQKQLDLSLEYYNFKTKEQYDLNENVYREAASLYKLPLNMFIYDEINAGNIKGEEKIVLNSFHFSEESTVDVYLGNAYSILELAKNSILYSDNVSAYALFDYLGGWYTYRQKTTKYSMNRDYSDEYYNNMYTASYMLDVLRYLYEHQEEYEILINQMLEVSNDRSLKYYVDVPIAQKEGWLINYWNVAGIVYEDAPYAVVIFTDEGEEEGPKICGEINFILHMHSKYSKQ